MSKNTSNMLDRLRTKIAKSVGNRGDLHLADYRLLSKASAFVLLGYDKSFGPVTSSDIQASFAREFDGQLTPVMSTAQIYADEGAVKVVAEIVAPTRRYEEVDRMLAVAGTMFLDQEMGETWNVVESADGKYLQRVMSESIDEILKQRRARMTVASRSVAFGNALSAGICNISTGDEVRFYADSSLHDGTIMKIDHNGVAIKTAKGNYTVVPEAVVQMLRMSPESHKMDQAELEEYYTKIYGPDYAKKLTSE